MSYCVKLRIVFKADDLHPYIFTKVCDFTTYEDCFEWFQDFMEDKAHDLKRVLGEVDHAYFTVKENTGAVSFKYRFNLDFKF